MQEVGNLVVAEDALSTREAETGTSHYNRSVIGNRREPGRLALGSLTFLAAVDSRSPVEEVGEEMP
ncbi:MAG: hypothetical protein GY953_56545 [bacterium]|nr:hypothetical protein [bacterium]